MGIGITAALGIAGLLSTHWMVHSQRKADRQKVADERRAQYRLDEHNRRAQLYADYLAELRSTVLAARLRNEMHANFWHGIESGILADIRTAARKSEGSEKVRLEALAEVVEKHPDLIRKAAQSRDDFAPSLNVFVTSQKLTILHARISLVAGADMSKAANKALGRALHVLSDLASSEYEKDGRRVEFDALNEAIDGVEIAGIYELRLRPYGETQSLGKLQTAARREAPASDSQPDS